MDLEKAIEIVKNKRYYYPKIVRKASQTIREAEKMMIHKTKDEAIKFFQWHAVNMEGIPEKITVLNVVDTTGEHKINISMENGEILNKKDVENIPGNALFSLPVFQYNGWKSEMYGGDMDEYYGEGRE